MPNFKTPEKVIATIRAGEEVERWRSENRAKINNFANGLPPMAEDKAKRIGLKVNTNFGQMARIFQHARRQFTNFFQARGKYFKVTIPSAPIEHKLEWEQFITQQINRMMKKSRKYFELGRSVWAGVVAHGIGASVWEDKEGWCPNYCAIENLRIPTDTQVSLENLTWFAVYKPYTPGELAKKVFGNNASPHWAKKTIAAILEEYRDTNVETTTYSWLNAPEKMWELYKQNMGFYTSDSAPTIPLWHFFYLDDSDPKKESWKLLVVPTMDVKGTIGDYDEFLYDAKDKSFASDIAHILHLQVGDLNNKPPFTYHAVRSLGFLLMEPCFWTNLLRCRTVQHTFEQFNIWLRVSDPSGSARAQKIELYDKAVIPDGVSIVPKDQRHQVDVGLVSGVMAELKGIEQEASVSYTQDTESGGGGADETATAVMARVTSVNAMMSGMLNTAARYATFQYQEISRRLCLRRTDDADAKRFQKECLAFGIPKVYLNSELWDVEPEIPMGAGNPTMEMAQAQQLMGARPMFGPTAQQEILHEFTTAVTGDSRKADRWAPVGGKIGLSDGEEWAQAIFGTLMVGVPLKPKEGLPLIDVINTLIGLTAGVVAGIEQSTNVATEPQLRGLGNAMQYTDQLVQQLAQNKAEGEHVKQYSDALGKLNNILKGFAQRLAEQGAQNNGNGALTPEAQAKIVNTGMVSEAKLKAKQESDAQKMAHKQEAFVAEQQRKDADTLAQIERERIIATHTPKAPGTE